MSNVIALIGSFILASWWLVTWKGGIVLVREFRRCLATGNPTDALPLLAGFGANLVLLLSEWSSWVAQSLHSKRFGIPVFIQGTGVILSIWFFGIVMLSRRRLGQMWTVVPNAPPSRLITAGPYSLVRHPIYASCIGFYGSICFGLDSTIAALLCFFQVMGFIWKAAREDRLLSQLIPADYDAYKSRVKWKLFWNIW